MTFILMLLGGAGKLFSGLFAWLKTLPWYIIALSVVSLFAAIEWGDNQHKDKVIAGKDAKFTARATADAAMMNDAAGKLNGMVGTLHSQNASIANMATVQNKAVASAEKGRVATIKAGAANAAIGVKVAAGAKDAGNCVTPNLLGLKL
jgi:hypothetical protein